MTSFKPEVQVVNDDKWYDNALRFATREEAEGNAQNLYSRWTSTTAWRAVESPDPVNYAWTDTGLVPVPPVETRGPMAHECTIISDRGIEVGVVEGDTLRVTARPAQQDEP